MTPGVEVSDRETVLRTLADRIMATGPSRRTRVAIDGIDAAGKTTLADDLAVLVNGRRPALRLRADDWQQPAELRYARGRESAEGYYRDGFDHVGLRTQALAPFAAGAPVRLRLRDVATDAEYEEPRVVTPPEAVLIVDGVFLLRPELRRLWDLSVRLVIDDAEAIRRGRARDQRPGYGPDEVEHAYHTRYLPGQRLYATESEPDRYCDLCFDMTDPAYPQALTRRRG